MQRAFGVLALGSMLMCCAYSYYNRPMWECQAFFGSGASFFIAWVVMWLTGMAEKAKEGQ